MSQTEVLLTELQKLPAGFLPEVIDFVQFLQQRKKKIIPETMLMGEASLAREWDTPEEDKAWANL
jgi:hypothetical protein